MKDTYHTVPGIEFSGVFCQQIYEARSYRYNDPDSMVYRIGIMGDYHLFMRSGDKVYMEVKKVGEIVMSFDDLQKNKYWKYYYNLSLMLANDQHKVRKNSAFNKAYDEIYEYTGERVWSLETAYIDLDVDQNTKKTYKIIPNGNVCYYRIDPVNLEGMEYTTPQKLDLFERMYKCRTDVRTGYFINRSVIYRDIAIEYRVSKMENELKELSAFFEDKKHAVNLEVLREKHEIDMDVLTILYNTLLTDEGNKKYMATIDEMESSKKGLERIAKLMSS